MPFHSDFFDLSTTDYSFENYLSYIETKGAIISKKNLLTYQHWYAIDLDFAKDKAKSNDTGSFSKLEAASTAFKNLAYSDFIRILSNRKGATSTTSIINVNSTHNNIIGKVECDSLSQQQELRQPQQQGNRKRKNAETDMPPESIIELDVNEKQSWESTDYHPRRKSKVNYLTGNFNAAFNPLGDPWNVNGRNMVQLLADYRNTSMAGARKHKNLSESRIMSLSFIFLFKIDQNSSCTHHLPRVYHVGVLNSINIRQNWMPLFLDSAVWCLRLGQQLKSSSSMELNTEAAKRMAMQHWLEDRQDDEQGPSKRMVADTLLSIIGKFEHWRKTCVLESTFISQHLMPFMECVFEKDRTFHGKQGESFVSRNGDNLDNGVPSLMADYTLSYETCFAREFDLFVVEVKTPGKTSSGQLQSDLIKIGKEMKRMVDDLVDARVDDIVVGGMLVQGVSCEIYIMDLKFDGVYRMTQLADFHLLRGPSDLMLVPEIIEYLLQIKTILRQTIENIDKRTSQTNSNDSENDNISTIGTPDSWKRKACGSPEKLK